MFGPLGMNWSALVIFLFLFVALPAFAICDHIQHPYPEVAKQWTLDDGSVCRTFYGRDGVTCVRP